MVARNLFSEVDSPALVSQRGLILQHREADVTKPAMNNRLQIAIIGYGEVGSIFARDLLARGDVEIATYDILFEDQARGGTLRAAARAAGVRPGATPAEAASHAKIVISAVTASSAAEVARLAAGYLKPGQIFFDINSASPGTKKAAAAEVNAVGATYVEGAVMAPVPGPDLKVPILAGGPGAAEAAELLNGLGMNVDAVTTEPGRASAMKLCRSIMIKGIEALIGDCAKAAEAWGVEDQVFGSLNASFPGTDFADLSKYMAGRVRQHGIRRAAEMREAAMMVEDLGLDPTLCRAVADAQERGSAPKDKTAPKAAE
jgi:3-hydroxyisobutyrate dehydrogenase-like beta-hydroxyacid dehydrogenase